MKADGINHVALLGAGMIGHGLALHFAKAGYQVSLYSRTQQTLDKAIESIKTNLPALLQGRTDVQDGIDKIISRIKITRSLDEAISKAPIIIESVAEDLKIKQDLFKELDQMCPKDVILATNTSVISITEIASKAKNRNRIVGAHFWFPPYLIPLVEVVKGKDTSDETMEIIYQFMKKAGKYPIKCLKDVPGFVANRLQHALWREAISIVEHGIADAATVDDAIKQSFGIRIAVLGPIENADMAGLDLILAIHNTVLKALEASPNPSPLLQDKVKKGELGFKSGKGFYDSWTPERIKCTRENLMKYLIDYSRRQQIGP
ncbi:MAG: 3-hydroxyacyl-CoA dehydrogenase family protein [Chloroflexi bacterium]|nr:3-hydroxyacyl-CoA dehydrogenase family protein [Chloroflexota bacterium]MBL7061166.1 3-hydroxyacyl-CoA dehydrogenase family protein [Dehalococcoidia bacterium]